MSCAVQSAMSGQYDQYFPGQSAAWLMLGSTRAQGGSQTPPRVSDSFATALS
jgi:hypothetical protein